MSRNTMDRNLDKTVQNLNTAKFGSGKIQNIEIRVRDKRSQWEPVKKVPGGIQFPFEIPLIAETDAIKIIKYSMTGAGRIETVQFYTIADKGD